jgi:hypothetical protein
MRFAAFEGGKEGRWRDRIIDAETDAGEWVTDSGINHRLGGRERKIWGDAFAEETAD